MRGKISRGKQPRFAPVFRLFSAPAPSARKKYAAFRFFLRLPLRRPASAFAAQALSAKKRSRRPSFPYYIYCLPIRTAQDFSTRAINRAPENRSKARFLGRGGAALQVERFAIGKMLTA